MNTQINSSNFRDLARGGQTTIHAIRMFLQVIKHGIWIACWAFALSYVGLIFWKTEPYTRYICLKKIEGEIKYTINRTSTLEVRDWAGRNYHLKCGNFINSPAAINNHARFIKASVSSFWHSLWMALIGFGLFIIYLIIKGKKQSQDKAIKGHQAVTSKQLNQMIRKKGEASDFSLAGVSLLKGSVTKHTLLAGTTGTGKTAAMKELMDQVRAKAQKAIVYDIEGAFIPNYYRPGKDIILNPLDERMPAWNIWQECEDLADFDSAAVSLMPEHLAGTDPFWIRSAHTIFSSAAMKLKMKNQTKTSTLLQTIFAESLQTIGELVKNTPAGPLASDKIEKTAVSIKATLSTYCKSLIYLKDEGEKKLFSIRRWIEANDDSWLFIASNAQKIDALRPLLSVWLDVAAKSILSLPHTYAARLWFFLDELASLHKLPNLMNALSRGRKYGAAFVAAIQDVHQLDTVYGKDEAKTLTSLFNTKIFYRTQEPSSATWMSKAMGDLELVEKKEGFSYGAHEMRDGVSIHQEKRKEAVVHPSDFLVLPDLQAYLKLPGEWPVAKIKFIVEERKIIAQSFVPRNIDNLLSIQEIKKENPIDIKQRDSLVSVVNEETVLNENQEHQETHHHSKENKYPELSEV